MKKYLYILFLFPIISYSCSSNLSKNGESKYYYSMVINYIKNDSTAIKFISKYQNYNNNGSSLKIKVSSKIMGPSLVEHSSDAIKDKLSFNLND